MTEDLENKESDKEEQNNEPEESPEVEKEPETKQDQEVEEQPQDNSEEKPIEEVEEKKEAEKEEKPEIVPENKEGKIPSILRGKNKKGSFFPIILIMIISIAMAIYWDEIPFIKSTVHSVLDPTAGELLKLNLTFGMIVIVLGITLMTTLVQKYATDQKALKELKKEQKILQEEMKKYKEHPEKMSELSKKQLSFIPKTFKLTSRTMLFTGIPFILFFRWFYDTFAAMGEPVFFGFLPWFWFYFIFMMVFSGVLRKVLKVV